MGEVPRFVENEKQFLLVTDLLALLELAVESLIKVIDGANKLLVHDELFSLSTDVDGDHLCAKFT